MCLFCMDLLGVFLNKSYVLLIFLSFLLFQAYILVCLTTFFLQNKLYVISYQYLTNLYTKYVLV